MQFMLNNPYIERNRNNRSKGISASWQAKCALNWLKPGIFEENWSDSGKWEFDIIGERNGSISGWPNLLQFNSRKYLFVNFRKAWISIVFKKL